MTLAQQDEHNAGHDRAAALDGRARSSKLTRPIPLRDEIDLAVDRALEPALDWCARLGAWISTHPGTSPRAIDHQP